MYSETRDEKRRATARLNAIASYITLASVIYYASAIVLLHLLRTDFDPTYRYLSEYARGRYGILMTSTFFALSAGSLALSFGLWRSVSSKLLFLPGPVAVDDLGMRCFSCRNLHRRSTRCATDSNWQDPYQMGMIALPSATLAIPLLSLALRWETAWRSAWPATMLLSLPSVVVVVCFLALDRFGQMGLGGLDQRIFLGATLIWMWIVGRKMLTIARQAKY